MTKHKRVKTLVNHDYADMFPTTVQVGSLAFPVIFSDMADIGEEEDGSLGNCLGCVNFNTGAIHLKEGRPFSHTRETLLHEVTHALAVQTGVPMEERDVQAFANALTDLLDRNPALVALFEFGENVAGGATRRHQPFPISD